MSSLTLQNHAVGHFGILLWLTLDEVASLINPVKQSGSLWHFTLANVTQMILLVTRKNAWVLQVKVHMQP